MNASVAMVTATVVPVGAQRTFADFADDFRRSLAIEPPAGPTIMPSGLFGPWLPEISEPDRRAGLRALAALCRVFIGSNSAIVAALRRAELEPEFGDQARVLFDKLPTLQRRRVLGTYAFLMRPPKTES